jgi:exopolysaccharide biosynthesis protein
VKIILPNINAFKFKPFLKTYVLAIIFILGLVVFIFSLSYIQINNINKLNASNQNLSHKLTQTVSKLKDLQNQDQYKINQSLKSKINNIESSYKTIIDLYQKISDLKIEKQETADLDKELAVSLSYIADLNYSSAAAQLKILSVDIKKKQDDFAAAQVRDLPIQNITQSNTPPSNGFSVQSVSTNNGNFTVYIIAADLNTTRVIVDTASTGDCGNNCPTMALSDYAARSGAYAAINGSFFCPVEYPSCAGKTGSFDLLIMNKNKIYFNSSNNVYSTNPAVIFYGNSARFVSKALEWGRDTGVDAVLSNFPLLINGGNLVYSGGGDAKFSQKGPRTFIANKGNTAYMGLIFNATMQDSADVLKVLGMDNAMNLDEGGSTALWFNGSYKAGPGRNIPNALLFVRK